MNTIGSRRRRSSRIPSCQSCHPVQKKSRQRRRRLQAGRAETEPTFADVSYGPAERNVLDFYQAAP